MYLYHLSNFVALQPLCPYKFFSFLKWQHLFNGTSRPAELKQLICLHHPIIIDLQETSHNISHLKYNIFRHNRLDPGQTHACQGFLLMISKNCSFPPFHITFNLQVHKKSTFPIFNPFPAPSALYIFPLSQHPFYSFPLQFSISLFTSCFFIYFYFFVLVPSDTTSTAGPFGSVTRPLTLLLCVNNLQ